MLTGIFSCEKEEFVDDPADRLEFSTDTVFFDTVFTTVGSATQRFTVRNPHDQKIKISSIALAGGKDSDYRLNINGRSTSRLNNVKLEAKDSLFIFVEVTVDPTSTDQPLMVKDSVVFKREASTQDVKLIAWGQDVRLIKGQELSTQTWTPDKPYLIYNSALVDTGSTLTIEAGTNIHFHRNSRFYVAGTLICEGRKDNPVIFQGDRPEEDYSDIPGQWGGIWLMPGSKNSRLNHTVIKNAITGLQVDSIAQPSNPTLELSNVKIMHMSHAGILAKGSSIRAYNCLITDCGSYAAALWQGGEYAFYHTTFANYWSAFSRNTPSVELNNYFTDAQNNLQVRDLYKAHFSNCIIYGNRPPEIGFDFKASGASDYSFSHCLIRTGSFRQLDPDHTEQIIENKDPLFISPEKENYRLDTLSPAIDQGDVATGNAFPTDLLNNSRIEDEAPDLGAYEYIPNHNPSER